MQVRVLLTDGQSTVELYWLAHNGRDIYCGPTFTQFKRSYHQSGQVHTKLHGKLLDQVNYVPLRNLRGSYPLTSYSFGISPQQFHPSSEYKPYTGGKADVFFTIDRRAIPESSGGAILWITLIEAGNVDALAKVSLGKMFVVRTDTEPWICLGLSWDETTAERFKGAQMQFVEIDPASNH